MPQRRNRQQSDEEAERIISKTKLARLIASRKACESEMAESRGAFGAKLKAAQEADNLDPIAFAMAYRLSKMDTGKQALVWRNLRLYVDMLEIGTQTDIEDSIAESRAREQATEEDFGSEDDAESNAEDDANARREATVNDILADGGATAEYSKRTKDALRRFRKSVSTTDDLAAVNRAHDRFATDHPEARDEALRITQERLSELADERRARGGEATH